MFRFLTIVSILLFTIMSDIDASPNGLRKTQLVGGFRNTDPNDERVFNAASFAVNLLCSGEASDKSYSFASSLISYNQRKESGLLEEGNELKLEVVEVKQQVVAGMNYDMVVQVSLGAECLGKFEVVVWDQFGDLQVTDWGDEIPCIEEDEGEVI